MTLVFVRYPILWALLALSVLLGVLCARSKRGTLVLTILAGLCVIGLVVTALACSVPYTELLILLLIPVLACFLAMGKGERS